MGVHLHSKSSHTHKQIQGKPEQNSKNKGNKDNSNLLNFGNRSNTQNSIGTPTPSSAPATTNPMKEPIPTSTIAPRTEIANAALKTNNPAKLQELKNKFDKCFKPDEALGNASGELCHGTVRGMYDEASDMQSLVTMYKATGDKKYIKYAVDCCKAYKKLGEANKENAKELYKDGYLHWKKPDSTDNADPKIPEYDKYHYEWKAGLGVAVVASEILTDSNLKSDPNFKPAGEELRDFVAHDVWDKWSDKDRKNNFLGVSETHFIGRMGTIALSLHKAKGDQKYLDYINKKGAELKKSITDNNGMILMSTKDSKPVDIYHGGDTVDFIVDAYRNHMIFDDNDMRKIISSFKSKVWNGSITDPKFSKFTDGSGPINADGQVGWNRLAAIDYELNGNTDLLKMYNNHLAKKSGREAVNMAANYVDFCTLHNEYSF